MGNLVKITTKTGCGRYGRIVAERAPGYTEIDVGTKTDRLPMLEDVNHVVVPANLYEEIDVMEIIGTVNKVIRELGNAAINAARWMNANYDDRDLNRNRVNYGVMTQALSTLRALGYDAGDATWGEGGFLICEEITISGRVVYKR